MKLIKKYELEMTAAEIKAFKMSIDREGGLVGQILDMVLGEPVEDDEESEEDDE